MMKLRVIQARYGDCLILVNEYGKTRRHILVDGGPSGVYGPYLRAELQRIAQAGDKIDIMVLTHVDNDHVKGLLEFIGDLKKAKDKQLPLFINVTGVWHNGFGKFLTDFPNEASQLEYEMMNNPVVMAPKKPAAPPPAQTPAAPVIEEDEEHDLAALDGGVSMGVKEGYNLLKTVKELRCKVNFNFPGRMVTLENAPRPMRVAGMRVYVLGPKQANLDSLRGLWEKWLTKEGLPFGPGAPVRPDDSETNLSSIMFLAEAGGRRILLTGDGLGDDIVAGLEDCDQLCHNGICEVDILKLPHHGSERNCVGQLFDRVQAKTYLICADGTNDNPDWQTLVWLTDAACRQNRDIHIFATHKAPSLDQLVIDRPPEKYHYTLTIMPQGPEPMEL